jgi:antitoxin (DNA-binding transcriptional repressor) of toxin-antitoxin stability system
MTATHASRGFSEVLDRVERGETIQITRDRHPVAELRPITPATGRTLRAALAEIPALDSDIETDIEAATALITNEVNGSWRDN